MNKEAFEEWLENPTTEYFIKYLKDSREEEVELLTEGILSGAILSELDQGKTSTLCETLRRISEITFEEIEIFYEEEK